MILKIPYEFRGCAHLLMGPRTSDSGEFSAFILIDFLQLAREYKIQVLEDYFSMTYK
ncbi:MAG: hypothetical protein UX90_C0002G0183 [Candidatus Wolfebacteria bacterium GW2011_GWD2_47_17]|uniref:Uncharacterized protein n=1 Tax=Candidatus Wolfebacteria bacterium GW2011_GWB1_47_1 TaxID=1619007 RepID=A0A0G4ARX0_9BACT|nr:MAG: hypothetical protein UX70_C0001G0168 [Candidatus Wolfebacteria bacterium GW2011_GWB1_47_1]KKU65807.1 MAG: hypothetical protein UX90_C0002G0183 [Candidatus Wolfebacteria bacterium GW2011_GWD2_47_17]